MRRFVLDLVTVLLAVGMGVPSMAAVAFADTEAGLLIQAPKAAKVGEKIVIQVVDEAGDSSGGRGGAEAQTVYRYQAKGDAFHSG